ncbi:MAG: hypothetical protein ACREPB_01710 [Arenimonas sp.]
MAGNISALTPGDLTASEHIKYEALKSNPQAAESFLATRTYARKAAAIVAEPKNKKIALDLARPKNYDERYLMPGDAKTISSAVDLSLNALAESIAADSPCNAATPPEVTPNTPSLSLKELNATELARYQLIKADPLTVKGFLATRGYVRKAAAIIAKPQDKKQALELKRPENFETRFLFTGDVATLNAAIEISLDALAESLFSNSNCD